MAQTGSAFGRGLAGITLGAASLVSIGCGGMGNYSNPELAIQSARVTGQTADLDVSVTNPSDFDLTLTGIDYSLLYGPFPVAEGVYQGRHLLPKGETARINMRIPFDSPPVDPSATEVELTGEMMLEDASNKGNMELENAAFSASGQVQR